MGKGNYLVCSQCCSSGSKDSWIWANKVKKQPICRQCGCPWPSLPRRKTTSWRPDVSSPVLPCSNVGEDHAADQTGAGSFPWSGEVPECFPRLRKLCNTREGHASVMRGMCAFMASDQGLDKSAREVWRMLDERAEILERQKAVDPGAFTKADKEYKKAFAVYKSAVKGKEAADKNVGEAKKALAEAEQAAMDAQRKVDTATENYESAHKLYQEVLETRADPAAAVVPGAAGQKRPMVEKLLGALETNPLEDQTNANLPMADDPMGMEGEDLEQYRKCRDAVVAAQEEYKKSCASAAESLRTTKAKLDAAAEKMHGQVAKRVKTEVGARAAVANSPGSDSGNSSPAQGTVTGTTVVSSGGSDVAQQSVEKALDAVLDGSYGAAKSRPARTAPYDG